MHLFVASGLLGVLLIKYMVTLPQTLYSAER